MTPKFILFDTFQNENMNSCWIKVEEEDEEIAGKTIHESRC